MTDWLAGLSRPFPVSIIEFKPGATQEPIGDSQMGKALGMAYVDPRHYYARLNEVCGMAWSDEYSTYPGPKLTVLCRLTIDGVTRTGDGECGADDQNAQTVASAQAFKRACVKFGLGAALYDSPQTWAEAKFGSARGNGKRNCFGFTDAGLSALRAAYGKWAAKTDPGSPVPPPAPPPPPAPKPAADPKFTERIAAATTSAQVDAILAEIAKVDQPQHRANAEKLAHARLVALALPAIGVANAAMLEKIEKRLGMLPTGTPGMNDALDRIIARHSELTVEAHAPAEAVA